MEPVAKKQEIYFSTDIEANGPIPGPYSMLSFASVAFDADGKELGSFEGNLFQLDGAKEDPDTMAWWGNNQEAYNATRENLRYSETVMPEYVEWVKSFGGMPVFVAYPAGYDFLFMYWYMIKFTKESPFSFSALDIKTYAAAMLKKPYRSINKKSLPKRWKSTLPHTHRAIDDAREQGELFVNMLRENLGTSA